MYATLVLANSIGLKVQLGAVQRPMITNRVTSRKHVIRLYVIQDASKSSA
jgi:hypothetical protein